MFGIHKKLKHWAAAGLISADQLRAITAHEKDRQQGRLGRGMMGLALFSIVVGILSLVAANWAAIPGAVKICVHLAANIALAVLVHRAGTRGQETLREGGLLVLGGLTLTLIALTGQVFQLGGALSGALLVWLMAILPGFLLYGRTRLTVLPALLAFVVSLPLIAVDFLEALPDFWSATALLYLWVLLPLGLLAAGLVPAWRALRPVWGDMAVWFGFFLLVLTATAASVFWYESRVPEMERLLSAAGLGFSTGVFLLNGPFLLAVAGLGLHRIFYGRHAEDSGFYMKSWALVLGSAAMTGLPVLLPGVHGDVFAMLAFLLYWGMIGWYAHSTGATRLLSLAITLLAIRIWVIYLEAFGGLEMTGIGLMTGGIFMLVMIFAARRLNKKLAGKA